MHNFIKKFASEGFLNFMWVFVGVSMLPAALLTLYSLDEDSKISEDVGLACFMFIVCIMHLVKHIEEKQKDK